MCAVDGDFFNMRYIIYKITNQINGKIYIGKHRCKRLDDTYFGSGLALKNAIKKYGKENFIFHLEFELQNQEELDLLEKCVVNEEYLKRADVYNLKEGGEGGGFYSLQSRQKISEALKGRAPTNKGRHHTEEAKQKMSASKKGCIPWNKGVTGIFVGEKSSMWGKHHSEEAKQKMRGPKSEIHKQHMRENHYDCSGEKHPMWGKHLSDETKQKISKTRIKFSVAQYTMDLKYVAEYESTREAERKTGIDNTSISRCCKGKQNSAGGFIFIYSDDICYFN